MDTSGAQSASRCGWISWTKDRKSKFWCSSASRTEAPIPRSWVAKPLSRSVDRRSGRKFTQCPTRALPPISGCPAAEKPMGLSARPVRRVR